VVMLANYIVFYFKTLLELPAGIEPAPRSRGYEPRAIPLYHMGALFLSTI
jgi:hypothetical protein